MRSAYPWSTSIVWRTATDLEEEPPAVRSRDPIIPRHDFHELVAVDFHFLSNRVMIPLLVYLLLDEEIAGTEVEVLLVRSSRSTIS